MSTLLSTAITIAGTITGAAQVIGYRHGVKGLGMQVIFAGGTGGTNVDVTVQTSLDGGGTWIDIWHCTQFVNTPARRCVAFSLNADYPAGGPPSDFNAAAALTAGNVNKIMGGHLRAKVVSTGTYSATSVQVDVYTEQVAPA